MRDLVTTISSRAAGTAAHLKPEPYLLHQAINALHADPADCTMIGDSPSDIEAARRAGTTAVALANKPDKHAALGALHPDALITSMPEVLPA